ncbi:MAG: anti-sigma factor antagonist [bacterium]
MEQDIKSFLESDKPDLILKAVDYILKHNILTYLSNILKLAQSSKYPKVKKRAHQVSVDMIRNNILGSFSENMPECTKKALVKLLMHLEGGETRKKALNATKSPIFNDRIQALQLIRLIGNNQMAESVLYDCLQDVDERIRASAVILLGQLVGNRDLNIVLKCLQDEDKRVRANAVEVIETLNKKHMVSILIRYRRDPNNRIKANVLKALWNLDYHELTDDFREMLTDNSEFMRSSALWALGEIAAGQPQLIELLKSVIYDDSEMVKANLLRTLNKIGDKDIKRYFNEVVNFKEIEKIKENIKNTSSLNLSVKNAEYFTILELKGNISSYNIISLKVELENLIKRKKYNIALDFNKVTFIDSSGMGLFVNFNKKIKSHLGKFCIFNCSDDILNLFELVDMDKIILVFSKNEDVSHIIR